MRSIHQVPLRLSPGKQDRLRRFPPARATRHTSHSNVRRAFACRPGRTGLSACDKARHDEHAARRERIDEPAVRQPSAASGCATASTTPGARTDRADRLSAPRLAAADRRHHRDRRCCSAWGRKDSDGHATGFGGGVWFAMLRTLDSGTMGGDAGPLGFLLAMLGDHARRHLHRRRILIGILTSGIEAQARGAAQGPLARHRDRPHGDPRLVAADLHDHLRAGRSPTRTSAAPRIVILADKDKVEMEDEIRRRRRRTTGKTRIVCRSGRPDRPRRPARSSTRRPRARSSSSRRRRDDPDARRDQDDPGDHQRPGPRAPSRTTSWPRSATRANMDVARMVGRDEARAGARRRPDRAASPRRPAASRACRSSTPSCSTSTATRSTSDAEPALVGRTFGEALLGLRGLGGDRAARRRRHAARSTRRWTRVIAARRPGSSRSPRTTTPCGCPGRPTCRIDEAAIRDVAARRRDAGAHADPRLELARPDDHHASSTTTSRPAPRSCVVADSADAQPRRLRAHAPACATSRSDVREGDTTDRGVLDALDVRRLRPRHRPVLLGRPAARSGPTRAR